MTWSFPIGRLLGSQLRVHITFFLLLAWIAFSAWGTGGAPAATINVIFVLALFACVVAHEYGHALMARRFGIPTPDITLLPIGGVARLARMPQRPGQEIAVALAGPAVNLVIAGVIYLALGRLEMANVLASDGTAAGFFGPLATINVWLVLFNMIPAFPMDGGRVLRATIAIFAGRARATRIASYVGQTIAVGFAIWGAVSGSPLLVLIAAFVFLAARAERAAG
ncbi:Putative zinc metalloprotease Rip3 [Roseivivax jejudonensis]|uniref:Putative zinc metalloprotease Rip3 n=1 Tax=Roseivivax jejudonensis TaxID=1529041 RepID=A0A1X6YUH9_9RHOB|nr:site-2 protease family protein [Roseivivax jejudonensis]SLN31573.1 Putative zinc metalloprotease Rip3 [Roseivivax jejudonensis]